MKRKYKKNNRIFWPRLQAGDIVDIVMPAFSCSKKEFRDSLKFLRSWGLVPRYPQNLFGKNILCSQTDSIRFQHLKKAFYAPDSQIIWCLRGGYGCLRLLPELKKLKKPSRHKLLIGYSDITVLHSFVGQRWGWPSLHGPNLIEMFPSGKVLLSHKRELKNILFGASQKIVFPHLIPLNKKAKSKVNKKMSPQKSLLVGGNLATLQFLVGTYLKSWSENKILFLEDVGEEAYRLDAMLTHLSLTGVFDKTRAVIFGSFTDFSHKREQNKKEQILWNQVQMRWAQNQKIPVFKGLPVGHGKHNHPILLNTEALLKMGKNPSLEMSL